MTIFLAIIVGFVAIVYLYMQQASFGKAPDKARVAYFNTLSNYKNGKFLNYSRTPNFTEGYTMSRVMKDFIFQKIDRKIPSDLIPTVKTDLLNLPLDRNVLVWFGHSSYFMQIDGKRILVDPVFSTNASPVPGTNQAFKGTDCYNVNDLPMIDYLFITHDHYDHLDYKTIIALKNKVGKVLCGLGVGTHLEYWGFSPSIIIEKNWHETIQLDDTFVAHYTPARHFSGRKLDRNNTLWVSYVLETASLKIFIGGDSGYDTHFAEIGRKFGPIDLAILENGQYNAAWKYHHSHPHEVVMAAKDLNTKRFLPVHSSKFALSNHAWDAPLIQVSKLHQNPNIKLLTPMIGEVLNLDDENQEFKEWWKALE